MVLQIDEGCMREGWRGGVETNLCYTRAQVAPHEELEALQLRLEHDERKVGARVHVASHLLHLFNLAFYAVVYPVEELARPSVSLF